MPFDHLLAIFRKLHNTPDQNLRLMDEWNALSFHVITNIMPSLILEEKTYHMLQNIGKIKLYLKHGIAEFQHNTKS